MTVFYTDGSLAHSAKGSTWEKHKYIKIINGLYFYPAEYVGGRHLPGAKKKDKNAKKSEKTDDSKKKSKDSSKKASSKDDKKEKSNKKIEALANDVIRGKYGVGQERVKQLGKKYDKVQHLVNTKLLGKERADKIYERKKKAGTLVASSSSSSKSSKGSKKKSSSSSSSSSKKSSSGTSTKSKSSSSGSTKRTSSAVSTSAKKPKTNKASLSGGKGGSTTLNAEKLKALYDVKLGEISSNVTSKNAKKKKKKTG